MTDETQDTTQPEGASQELTPIPEYTQTALALVELAQRYKDVVYPVDTREGMEQATEARAVLRTLRTSLDKKRKEIKAPALQRCREIDSEANRLTDAIEALEDPIDVQIKNEQGRKEHEKAERQAAEDAEAERLRNLIAEIRGRAVPLVGADADALGYAIADTRAINIEATFPDGFRIEAAQAKGEVIARLETMYAERKSADEDRARLDAERAELDRQRAADAWIREISKAPTDVLDKSAATIEAMLIHVNGSGSNELAEEHRAQAEEVREATLRTLRAMLASAQRHEREDAERKAQDDAAEKLRREAAEVERAAREGIEAIRELSELFDRSATVGELREALANVSRFDVDAIPEHMRELANEVATNFVEKVKGLLATAEQRETEARERTEAETAERERQIRECTLQEAAAEALGYLTARGHGDELVSLKLAAALKRDALDWTQRPRQIDAPAVLAELETKKIPPGFRHRWRRIRQLLTGGALDDREPTREEWERINRFRADLAASEGAQP